MKNVLRKIAYMVIGSLLTIIGYHFGNIENNTADAQEKTDNPIVDEIRCRHLLIVNEDGERVVSITTGDTAGGIGIYNNEGTEVVSITTGDTGGGIGIYNNEGTEVVGLAAASHGSGGIELHNKDKKRVVQLGTYADGRGALVISDKDGKRNFAR